MRNQEISKQLQYIDNLFNKSNDLAKLDIEILSHWGKYLCVLSAGIIENGIKEIYGEFVKNAASVPVAKFARQKLSRIRNPKTGTILEVANSFKSTWMVSLNEYVNENGRKEAIDSIMTNRHNIAHGKKSTITVTSVKDYYKKAIQVIEYIA